MKIKFSQIRDLKTNNIKKIGLSGQRKIFSGNVVIIGLGGLGCPLLTYFLHLVFKKLELLIMIKLKFLI